MKSFYITDRETLLKHKDFFHPELGSSYIDLPDGGILAAIEFHADAHQDRFEAEEKVASLPHPIFEGNVPLKQEHADRLAHIGIKRGHNVVDVIRFAGKHQPGMRIGRRF
jgi:hypothetical protein